MQMLWDWVGGAGVVLGGATALIAVLGTVFKLALGPWWTFKWHVARPDGMVMVEVENRSHLVGKDVTLWFRSHDSGEWFPASQETEVGFGQKVSCHLSLVRDDTPAVSSFAGILQPPKGVAKPRKLRVRVTWHQLPFMPLRHSKRSMKFVRAFD